MPNPKPVRTSLLATHSALAALWLVLAFGMSAFAIHATVMAVRAGDIALADAGGGLARMASSMAERGASTADISSAIVTAGRARGFDVVTQPFPERRMIDPHEARDRMPPPFGVMSVNIPDALDPPSLMLHTPGLVIIVRLAENPWLGIAKTYATAMFVLIVVAFAVTWIVNRRSLSRAFAPVATIESALRRLAGGEYSRLAVVSDESGEAGVVDAYNAAADELASSIRLRAEAESNLRQFVADAGHELRTPLTVIMGFVDVLRQGAIAEQALAQRILESVATEGERMRRLIARLLMLARLDAVAPERQESVNLSAIAADTVASFQPLAGASKLQVRTEPDVLVAGSASDVREVVGILVDNALKYAPGADVVVSTSRDGRFGTLIVADDGPGMPPDLRVRAFDRFSRGDERGSVPGSGLGLAIVKRIAVRAGGDAELESAQGKGTQVRVRLPLAGPS